MQIDVLKCGKTIQAINSLPDNPVKKIYWIVYNEDMVKYTQDLIIQVKGEEYFHKYVRVVPKGDSSKRRSKGTVYFDPNLMDLISNGST